MLWILGKFGGLQNKAPPIERLRGVVFAAPLPLIYHNICTQLGIVNYPVNST